MEKLRVNTSCEQCTEQSRHIASSRMQRVFPSQNGVLIDTLKGRFREKAVN